MILEAYACSDVGKKRTNNEDNLYFNGQIKEETASSFSNNGIFDTKKGNAIFGVFDGMGGYAKGEVAASITAKTAKKIVESENSFLTEQLLNKICTDANSYVCKEIENESGQKMGSTLSMLCFDRSNYHICDVGDSPVYLYRGGKIQKISMEHTEAVTYAKIYGELPPKDKKFPLTQHIGMPESVARLKPYYAVETVAEGDIFLICSDGLSDMIDDSDIEQILQSDISLSDMTDRFLSDALANGGRDNITFIIIKVVSVNKIENNNVQTDFAKDTYSKNNQSADAEIKNTHDNSFIIKCTIGIVIIALLVIVLINFSKPNSSNRPVANSSEDVLSTSKIDTESKIEETDTEDEDVETQDKALVDNRLDTVSSINSYVQSIDGILNNNDDDAENYPEGNSEQIEMYGDSYDDYSPIDQYEGNDDGIGMGY